MRIDERTVVTQIDRLTLRELRLWVREGWIRPSNDDLGPVFDELDMARIRLLCDLRKDLSLSADAITPILALMDRLHQTRRDLRWLTEALDEQSDDVRQSILASFRRRRDTGDSDQGS